MTAGFGQDLIALLPRLRRFALSLTGKADEADDLVQATCERALRAQANWEPGSRLDSWLFRILKNLWIDQIRRRKTEGGQAPAEEAEELAGSDGRAITEGRIGLGEVERALARLPPDQEEIIRLVCVAELSYRDAAERLGMPIGTVMSRLARARQALAVLIETGGSARRTNETKTEPG